MHSHTHSDTLQALPHALPQLRSPTHTAASAAHDDAHNSTAVGSEANEETNTERHSGRQATLASPRHSARAHDARAASTRSRSASPQPPQLLDRASTPEVSATSCTFHYTVSHEEEPEAGEAAAEQLQQQQPLTQPLTQTEATAVRVRPLNLSPPNHPVQTAPRSRSVRSDQTPRIDYLAPTPQRSAPAVARPTRSRSLIQLPASKESADEQSSMEHWDGRADELLGGSKPVMLRVMTCEENDAEGSGHVAPSPSPSRRTQRKSQQRRLRAPSIARMIDRQFTDPFAIVSVSESSVPVTDPDFESETSPLTSAFRIDVSPPSAVCEPTATVEAHKTEATSSDDPPRSKPWYRKKRLMVPLLCLSALVLSVIIALIVLYPQPPEITTTSVTLSDMLWAVDESTGSLSANLTLAVGLQLRNNNRFGSRFDETPIGVFLSLPSGIEKQVTTLIMPSGHIGPKSELSLMITSRVLDARLSSVADVAALAQRLKVSSDSRTHGKISMLGIQIPYTVHTQCSAICSINIFSLAVSVREQQCNSSAA